MQDLRKKRKEMKLAVQGLWLQYMKMVDILKRFLRAEKTGDK